jgi:hypothetical protein
MSFLHLYQSPDSHGCALRELVISRHLLCCSGYHFSIFVRSSLQISAPTETVFYPSPSRYSEMLPCIRPRLSLPYPSRFIIDRLVFIQFCIV